MNRSVLIATNALSENPCEGKIKVSAFWKDSVRQVLMKRKDVDVA